MCPGKRIAEPPVSAAVALVVRRATAGLITLDRSLEAPTPIRGPAPQRGLSFREDIMSVVKFLELSAQSPNSYEDAIREAVDRASSTLRNIRSVWVKEFEAVVENDKVTQFRAVVKISFELEEGGSAG
jgi:dodecin